MKPGTRRAQIMRLMIGLDAGEEAPAFWELLMLALKLGMRAEAWERREDPRAAQGWEAYDKVVRVARSLVP